MEKALLYKEWLKTRRVFWVALAVAMALSIYAVIMINRLVSLKGVEHLWLIMLLKDNTFIDIIKYSPAAVGIAIGLSQMVPEMIGKRLKLTLHLPYPQRRLVMIMLATGLAELCVIFVFQAAVIVLRYWSLLPAELVGRVMLTALPWYFAGFTAYLFVTAICLEGTRIMRVILGLLGVATLMIYFLQGAPEAYNGMTVLSVVFICLLVVLSFGSVIRFKEGRQD